MNMLPLQILKLEACKISDDIKEKISDKFFEMIKYFSKGNRRK